MQWLIPQHGGPNPYSLYPSKASMLSHNDQYRRVVDDLITPGRKHLHVVPGVTADASVVHVAEGLVLPTMTHTFQLQKPVANPAQYFTDKLIRDPPLQPSWWSDLRQTLHHNPGYLLQSAFTGIIDVLKYIGWNYVDFIDQIHAWDGTWTGLLTHSALLWRTAITALITVGLLQAGPLLLAITEWGRMLASLLTSTFELVGDAMGFVWYAVEDILTYITSTLSRVLNGY